MGLQVDIYRGSYNSRNNIFQKFNEITLVNVPGPSQPSEKAPAALLIRRDVTRFSVEIHDHIIQPAELVDGEWVPLRGHQFANGGSLADASDSRFSEATNRVPVRIHDYSLHLERANQNELLPRS